MLNHECAASMMTNTTFLLGSENNWTASNSALVLARLVKNKQLNLTCYGTVLTSESSRPTVYSNMNFVRSLYKHFTNPYCMLC